ncbi:hypothetical protein [Saccharothrix sp. Mg75]|uniref:hypothetical protein n=1 Tax=Saccharothrix sp. Mg75 TaxID=3445357 RepID=UPI003EE9D88E
MTDRTHRGGHTALAVNGLLGGAGSLYLVTGSGVTTTVVTALAVLLAVVLSRGSGRDR